MVQFVRQKSQFGVDSARQTRFKRRLPARRLYLMTGLYKFAAHRFHFHLCRLHRFRQALPLGARFFRQALVEGRFFLFLAQIGLQRTQLAFLPADLAFVTMDQHGIRFRVQRTGKKNREQCDSDAFSRADLAQKTEPDQTAEKRGQQWYGTPRQRQRCRVQSGEQAKSDQCH